MVKTQYKCRVPSSEITPESVYNERRRLLCGGLAVSAFAAIQPSFAGSLSDRGSLGAMSDSAYSTFDKPTKFESASQFNNFYEFGLNKGTPRGTAQALSIRPWTVEVSGECEKPSLLDFDALLKPHALEERIYRFRCVEGWSMVIPWNGVSLAEVLKRFQPTSKAKYVAFETVNRPAEMPGLRSNIFDWPYREGLRIDEAMHPLSFLAVGMYGNTLPKQNGAPLRLVVPWKYGFKSIKSVVKIRFTEQQPVSSWHRSASDEYGFYANVNPAVDHPRWSQAQERRIGEWFMRPTLAFNGYADQVADLYKGMDLQHHF